MIGLLAVAVREIQNVLHDVISQVSELNWRKDNALIHGYVTDIDPKKQICRIAIAAGENADEPVKSAWIPYGSPAGTRKYHSPPSKGQQMTLFSPSGDIRQAIAIPYTFSKKNPSPSEDGDADVEVRGKTRKTQKDADLKYEVDGLTHSWTKQSTSTIIHKDKQKKEEKIAGGDDDKVDDKHPWKGNKEKAIHKRAFSKEDGYTLTLNIQEDGKKEGKEHKLKVHPDGGFTFSFGDEKHIVSINQDSIGISFDGGKHKIELSPEGIKHKSSGRVTIDAPQIEHQGDMKILGSLLASGGVQSEAGFIGNLQGISSGIGFPGGVKPPTDW